VLFVLATTELSKLPSTIVSRCQRYDFRRLTSDAIISRLHQISSAEGIRLEDSGARLIAKMAQGGMRDAISLLELCAGTGEAITESLAARVLGVGGRETPGKVVDALVNRDYPVLYRLVDELVKSSQDLSVFWNELIDYYRDLIVVKTIGDAREYLDLTEGEQTSLSDRAARIPLSKMLYHSRILEETADGLRKAGQGKRSIAELALVRMCEPKLSASPESLVARIEDLEKQLARLIASGGIVAPAAASAPSKQASSLESAPKESEEPPSEEPKTDAERKSKASGGDRALDSWGLVLEEFAELKPSLRPFLKGSTATVSEDGTLTVTLTVKLFLGMLSGDEASKTMLLNIVRSKGEAVSAIRFVSGAKQENKNQIEF
jgi:DNA polymerase-3 subunit gamma/tau